MADSKPSKPETSEPQADAKPSNKADAKPSKATRTVEALVAVVAIKANVEGRELRIEAGDRVDHLLDEPTLRGLIKRGRVVEKILPRK